jgi:hypothetical protein
MSNLVFYPIPSLANRTFFSCKSDLRSPSRVSRVSVDYLTDSETQPRPFIVDDGGFAPVISEPVIFAPGIYISCTRYLPTLHPSTLGPPAPTSTVTIVTSDGCKQRGTFLTETPKDTGKICIILTHLIMLPIGLPTINCCRIQALILWQLRPWSLIICFGESLKHSEASLRIGSTMSCNTNV